MSRTQKSFINAIAGVGSKFAIMLLGFISRTIFIKALSVEYLGTSSLFSSILTMLSLAELGFSTAITYNLYKPIAEKDNAKIAALMNFYRKVYIIVGIFVLAVGLLLMPFLKDLITGEIPNIKESIYLIYALYLVNTSVSYFFSYKSTLLEASQNKYISSIIHIVVFILKTIVNSVALLLTKNFILYLIIEILFTLIYNFSISTAANKKFPELLKNKKEKLDKKDTKLIFNNVKATFLYKIANVILDGTDNIIINKFIGTAAVGIYSNYYMIISQTYNFILQIFHATTASIGNLAAVETSKKQERVFNNLIFLSFNIYFICSAILFGCFTPFIKIWIGDSYLLDISIVAILILNFYTTGMLSPLTAFRTANGLFMQGRYRPLIMAIINIIISILLVKSIGLIGVFLGTFISRLTTQLWYDPWLIYRRVFKKSPIVYFIKYTFYLLVSIAGTAITYMIGEFIPNSNLVLKTILIAVIGMIVSIGMIVIIFRKSEEYQYVKNLIKSTLKKITKKMKGEKTVHED